MRTSIDQSFQHLAAQLPLTPHSLLQQLGEGDRQSWDELVALEPCRELPSLVARDIRPTPPLERIDGFVRAHQLGVFFGFVADRIGDGEAQPTGALLETRETLGAAWALALGEAMASLTGAQRAVRRARCLFDGAIEAENRCWKPRGLTPDAYARIVCAKLYWAGIATRALIAHHAPELTHPFSVLFRILLGSLQLCDDAVDGEQDRARRGASAAEVLNVPAPALIVASTILNAQGARVAEQAGLASFSRWFEQRTHEVASLSSQGDLASRLAGQALVSAFTASALPRGSA